MNRLADREPAVSAISVFCLCSHLDQFGSLRSSAVKKSSKGARVAFQLLRPEPDTFSVFVF